MFLHILALVHSAAIPHQKSVCAMMLKPPSHHYLQAAAWKRSRELQRVALKGRR